jgi:Raf kinase inhibitor-like YbhB/YbcL family protein
MRRAIPALALLAALPVAPSAQTPATGGDHASTRAQYALSNVEGQKPAPATQPGRPAMTLTTTAFPDGGVIPNKYSQAGEQVSPALSWSNVPPGTQSFVLNMRDPDVARNKGTDDQVHWVVWNIPGTATGLPEGVPKGDKLPDGSQQISASGPVYRGPGAPATGPMHHYTFELFALDTKLDVPAAADAWEARAAVYKAMQGHVLGKAVYVGLFRRPQ